MVGYLFLEVFLSSGGREWKGRWFLVKEGRRYNGEMGVMLKRRGVMGSGGRKCMDCIYLRRCMMLMTLTQP